VKVLVFGASGQVGSEVCKVFSGCEVVKVTHAELDVRQTYKLRSRIFGERADVVINCTAFHNVVECERFPGDAYLVNAEAVCQMAVACKKVDSKFVTLSTDYVFDGRKGSLYVESDEPNPLNVYGRSKLCGEVLSLRSNPESLVIRTAAVFGVSGCRAKGGRNFVDVIVSKLLQEGCAEVVCDQIVSPTYASDLAQRIRELVIANAKGMFHVTNSGLCSWFEFASEIYRRVRVIRHIECKLFPVETRVEGVARPKFSALTSLRCCEVGLPLLRDWRSALGDYLTSKYGNSK